MPFDVLRNEAGYIKLNVGDMIQDTHTGSKGFLTSRIRRIDMVEDDIYVWEIQWFSQDVKYNNYNNPIFLEEEGLRLSILIGTVKLYSAHKEE
jgi:hypothetical protein